MGIEVSVVHIWFAPDGIFIQLPIDERPWICRMDPADLLNVMAMENFDVAQVQQARIRVLGEPFNLPQLYEELSDE